MYGLCVYYDRCNQDDYSTKSDKKKLTGLTVSLFLDMSFRRTILLPVSSNCKRW